ncbi:MAG: hypothetical protein U1A07_24295, partial [Phenylobacterium sp.]|nr:hypothetical protein [Phenylobacterium sp.]
MIALRILSIALLLAVGTPVGAQVWQPRPGESPLDQHRWQADQHRLEMDRLRARADQREAAARQQQMETRLNRLGIEAARRPEPVQSPAPLALRSPA